MAQKIDEHATRVKWSVRMFGTLDVVSHSNERPKFRSKSVGSLLAYLALRPGESVSRFLIQECLWPDSDCDKQGQNLRRAVSDLRDALEDESDRGKIVVTRRDVVTLDPTHITSDVARLWSLSEQGLRDGNEEALAQAMDLYSGPLLSAMADDWIYAYRLELEERFGQIVDAYCQVRIRASQPKEAIRACRTALLAAPNREDIHVALIEAYRVAGLEAEAIRQFEDLERMLDEQWGEPPSDRAKQALEGPLPKIAVSYTPPSLRPLGAEVEPSGGAVPLDSPFYVEREVDAVAQSCVDRSESVMLLQGARQVGKSSLLARVLAHARGEGMSVALSDFQAMGESQLYSEDRLYRTLCHSLSNQLEIDVDIEALWNPWLGPNLNLDAIVGAMLKQATSRVVWAVDEADRLFDRTYTNDFFGLLRSWHNRRALDPTGPWSKLTLAISYATEAHLFITDLNQSPFNVGVRLSLRDFTAQEVHDLGGRCGFEDRPTSEAVHEVTHGHPFLTRRSFAFLAQGGTVAQLRDSSGLEDGPFGDHLQRMLTSIARDAEVAEEVRRLLRGEALKDPTSKIRLWASGVLDGTSHERSFRVPVYRDYLARHLQIAS